MCLSYDPSLHQTEISARTGQADGCALGADIAVELLAWHTPADEAFSDASGRSQGEANTPCEGHPQYDGHPYVLVMQCAECSLHDVCMREFVAGRDFPAIRDAMRSVGCCVRALHARGMCHGNLTQRNVLRSGGRWVLCGLGAARRIGEPIGGPTSTAYGPPELARTRFVEGPEDDLPAAEPSFDVWSFGVVLYEMCCGQPLFLQDTTHGDLVRPEDRAELCAWCTVADDALSPLLELTRRGARLQDVQAARHLIRWCLQGRACDRPTMEEVRVRCHRTAVHLFTFRFS